MKSAHRCARTPIGEVGERGRSLRAKSKEPSTTWSVVPQLRDVAEIFRSGSGFLVLEKPREAMKGDSVSSDDEVVNTVRVQQLDELFQISLQLVQGMRGASMRVRVRYQVVLEGSKRDKTRHRRVRHPQRRCRPQELVPLGEFSTGSWLGPRPRWAVGVGVLSTSGDGCGLERPGGVVTS